MYGRRSRRSSRKLDEFEFEDADVDVEDDVVVVVVGEVEEGAEGTRISFDSIMGTSSVQNSFISSHESNKGVIIWSSSLASSVMVNDSIELSGFSGSLFCSFSGSNLVSFSTGIGSSCCSCNGWWVCCSSGWA